MHANGAPTPLRFPSAATDDFFVSGYAHGAEGLGGAAAVVDEPVGDGRTVAFGFEPNFRAFTDGTQRVLRNAHGLRYREVGSPGRTAFAIANPGALSGDEIPWADSVARQLRSHAVPVVMLRMP